MSETFLSKEEVRDMTGRTHLDKQISWLEDNGFVRGLNFWVNAKGRPIVPRSKIEGGKQKVEAPRKKWQPDEGATLSG